MRDVSIDSVRMEFPEGCNIILGQSHFIKTVEDLYEAIAMAVPGGSFGIAFSEASGPRLVRSDGTDLELRSIAERNLLRLGCGHTFLIVMSGMYPVQVLDRVKNVPEVCTVFCATANPVEVIRAVTEQGGAVLGVVDGEPPIIAEIDEDRESRIQLLQRIGYKR